MSTVETRHLETPLVGKGGSRFYSYTGRRWRRLLLAVVLVSAAGCSSGSSHKTSPTTTELSGTSTTGAAQPDGLPASQAIPTRGPRGTTVHLVTTDCGPDFSAGPGGHFVHFFDSSARAHPDAGAFLDVRYTVSGFTVSATWSIPATVATGQSLFVTSCGKGNGVVPFEVTG